MNNEEKKRAEEIKNELNDGVLVTKEYSDFLDERDILTFIYSKIDRGINLNLEETKKYANAEVCGKLFSDLRRTLTSLVDVTSREEIFYEIKNTIK